MTADRLTCSNAECNLTSDGKCVEGYDPNECPHTRMVSLEDIPEEDEPDAEPVLPEPTLGLPSGEALDRNTASDLQRRRISKAVGLIGPNDSGKTSLIAGVYDLLQEGPVADATFAGSATLIAFEKVCHLARAVSKRTVPHTERTSRGADATFFHLDLLQKDGRLTALFIGDRSGEDYLAAADQMSQAEQFFEIRRADCVTLLVNGAQLADAQLRHEAKAIAPQIVEALVESGTVRKGCRLAIVLTKKDCVVASPEAERVQKDFDALVASIRAAHGHYVGEVKSFVVAASPNSCEQVARGEGLGDLVLFWLQSDFPAAEDRSAPRVRHQRMIDRLTSEG